MDDVRGYFEFLAGLGMTKHVGSMPATRQLVELCRLKAGQLVLVVGCGAVMRSCTWFVATQQVQCTPEGASHRARGVLRAGQPEHTSAVRGR